MTYDISQRYAVGDLVLTPLGRRARVLGFDCDDRAELEYVDAAGERPANLLVSVHQKLLKRLPQ